MARDLKRERLTRRVADGELSYDREWVEREDGDISFERISNGRLNGQPISDRELRLILER